MMQEPCPAISGVPESCRLSAACWRWSDPRGPFPHRAEAPPLARSPSAEHASLRNTCTPVMISSPGLRCLKSKLKRQCGKVRSTLVAELPFQQSSLHRAPLDQLHVYGTGLVFNKVQHWCRHTQLASSHNAPHFLQIIQATSAAASLVMGHSAGVARQNCFISGRRYTCFSRDNVSLLSRVEWRYFFLNLCFTIVGRPR